MINVERRSGADNGFKTGSDAIRLTGHSFNEGELSGDVTQKKSPIFHYASYKGIPVIPDCAG